MYSGPLELKREVGPLKMFGWTTFGLPLLCNFGPIFSGLFAVSFCWGMYFLSFWSFIVALWAFISSWRSWPSFPLIGFLVVHFFWVFHFGLLGFDLGLWAFIFFCLGLFYFDLLCFSFILAFWAFILFFLGIPFILAFWALAFISFDFSFCEHF